VDTVFEYDLVEVGQKTQWFIQESHVAKQLNLVNWKDLLDCLELNDETIVNQHVKTKWFFEDKAFVFDWNAQFVFGWDVAQLTFPAHASVVDGLQ